MRKILSKLWNDDGGAIIAMEWVFIATILVLGIITGLVAVRQAVLTELSDVAQAILSLNQSYSFTGQSNCQASTAGSQFTVNPSQNTNALLIHSTPPVSPITGGQLACD